MLGSPVAKLGVPDISTLQPTGANSSLFSSVNVIGHACPAS